MLRTHLPKYLLAKIVPAGINFLNIIFLTHLMTQESYGLFTTTVTASTILGSLAFSWLGLGFVRHNFHDTPTFASSLRSAYIAAALAGTVTFLIGLSAFLVAPNDLSLSTVLCGISVCITNGYYELNLQALRARLLPRQFAISGTIRSILFLALSLPASQLFQHDAILMALAFANLIAAGYAKRYLCKLTSTERTTANSVKNFLIQCSPFLLPFFISALLNGVERLVLAHFGKVSEAAIYGATYDILRQSVYLIFSTINLAVFPIALNALKTEGDKLFAAELKKGYRLILLGGLIFFTYTLILGPKIFPLVLPTAYVTMSASIAPILALCCVISAIREFYFDQALIVGSKTKARLISLSIGVCVTVAISVPATAYYGACGTAYGALAGSIAALFFTILFSRAHIILDLEITYALKVLFAASISTVPCLLLSDKIALGIPLAVGALGVILHRMQIFRLDGSARRLAKTLRS